MIAIEEHFRVAIDHAERTAARADYEELCAQHGRWRRNRERAASYEYITYEREGIFIGRCAELPQVRSGGITAAQAIAVARGWARQLADEATARGVDLP